VTNRLPTNCQPPAARDFPPLVLDVPCSLFTVTTRDLQLAAEVRGC
jgi:hypothetical protein